MSQREISSKASEFQRELQAVVDKWNAKVSDDRLCHAEMVGSLECVKHQMMMRAMYAQNPHLLPKNDARQ